MYYKISFTNPMKQTLVVPLPILQMRNLRHGDGSKRAWAHTAAKWRGRDSIQAVWPRRPRSFPAPWGATSFLSEHAVPCAKHLLRILLP